ncbi:MAG: hypothetical protein ACXAEU_08225 [Candidatus Hodarchaeales archaeon]
MFPRPLKGKTGLDVRTDVLGLAKVSIMLSSFKKLVLAFAIRITNTNLSDEVFIFEKDVITSDTRPSIHRFLQGNRQEILNSRHFQLFLENWRLITSFLAIRPIKNTWRWHC